MREFQEFKKWLQDMLEGTVHNIDERLLELITSLI